MTYKADFTMDEYKKIVDRIIGLSIKEQNNTISKKEKKELCYLLILENIYAPELSYDDYLLLCCDYFDDSYNILKFMGNSFKFDYSIKRKNQNQLLKEHLEDDKLLFIADTHYGSSYEDRSLIYSAYNYAIKNNFHTVIHAGDLIEGFMKSRREYVLLDPGDCLGSYDFFKKQFDRIEKILPPSNLIQTKLLLGNHDYWAIHKQPQLLYDFFQTEKLDIMGTKKVILEWQDLNFSLFHGIPSEEYTDQRDDVVALVGHSHVYGAECDKRVIRIPTLSNDYPVYKSLKSLGITPSRTVIPLFITLERVDTNTLLFRKFNLENLKQVKIGEEIEVNTKTKKLIPRKK